MRKMNPNSIVFSWIEAGEDGEPIRVTHALDVSYMHHQGVKLQDTSLGREILAGLKKGASPNIWFSDVDAYEINYPEESLDE